jgi:hypothetical protein
MLEPGVVTCPPTGEVCACTPEAASNATINTENNKQWQRSYQKIHSFLSFDRPALLAVNL